MNVYFSYLDLLRQLASKFHLSDEVVLQAISFPFFSYPPLPILGLPWSASILGLDDFPACPISRGNYSCRSHGMYDHAVSQGKNMYRPFLVQGATPIVF